MVQKTMTVVEEGYILEVPIGFLVKDVTFEIPIELPPNTKINWAKLHFKFHCEAKGWLGDALHGWITAKLNENKVFSFVPNDCETKDDFVDVTPYIFPLTGGTEGSKAINRLWMRGENAGYFTWAKFHFPIDLTIDYSGEEPAGEGAFVGEEPTPTFETLLTQALAKPESVVLIAIIGIALVVLIGIMGLVRR